MPATESGSLSYAVPCFWVILMHMHFSKSHFVRVTPLSRIWLLTSRNHLPRAYQGRLVLEKRRLRKDKDSIGCRLQHVCPSIRHHRCES